MEASTTAREADGNASTSEINQPVPPSQPVPPCQPVPPSNVNPMKELKAKWLKQVQELNEHASAQAHGASPRLTRVKPKQPSDTSASTSERLPVINLGNAEPPKRTSLMGYRSSGSGRIRYSFNSQGQPDPPKPPPSPFEAYSFADFTVSMPKVIQEVERTSQTGGKPRISKMQEVPEESTLPSSPGGQVAKPDAFAKRSFAKRSEPGSVTDAAKVIISIPSPAKQSPHDAAAKKAAPRGFCLCFKPQVVED